MHTEGGGEQVLELFMRVSKDPVSKDRDRQIAASKSRWWLSRSSVKNIVQDVAAEHTVWLGPDIVPDIDHDIGGYHTPISGRPILVPDIDTDIGISCNRYRDTRYWSRYWSRYRVYGLRYRWYDDPISGVYPILVPDIGSHPTCPDIGSTEKHDIGSYDPISCHRVTRYRVKTRYRVWQGSRCVPVCTKSKISDMVHTSMYYHIRHWYCSYWSTVSRCYCINAHISHAQYMTPSTPKW